MYTIDRPDPTPLVNLDGSPICNSDGNQIHKNFASMVDELTCEALFAGEPGSDQFNIQTILAALRVSQAARHNPCCLSDEDYARLRRAAERTTLHPVVGRCVIPHLLAILSAKLDT